MLGFLQYVNSGNEPTAKAYGFDSEVQKGGPGSGPQGGSNVLNALRGNKSDAQEKATNETNKAHDATDKAERSGSSKDHANAASLHEKAAQSNSKAALEARGNNDKVSEKDHTIIAQNHTQQSLYHAGKSR